MNRWSSGYDDDEPPPPARPVGGGAWVFLFACGAQLVVSALFWISQRRFFDSAIYLSISDTAWRTLDEAMPSASRLASALVRFYRALGLSAGILIMGVWGSPRRAIAGVSRWAWYAFWTLPLGAALDLASLGAYHALTLRNAAWDLALLGLALVGLIAGYQDFFPAPPSGRREEYKAHSR